MISNPKHGWCDFRIGDFVGTPSYVTMVPLDLLYGFSAFLSTKEPQEIFLDEEGTEFSLFLNAENPRIEHIGEDGETITTYPISADIKALAKELCDDIANAIWKWADFCSYFPSMRASYYQQLHDGIENLRKLL